MPKDPADPSPSAATPPEEDPMGAEAQEENAFDAFMAECIEALEGDGPAALEALLSTRPAEAERARARLASLSKLGLLALPDTDWQESIGPYRVIRRLGGGGMGEVVLAEHRETGARVALKLGPIPEGSFTPDHDRQTQRAQERFAREVQSVRNIDHPSIAPILDVGHHKGRSWFASEFVDGVSLDRVLEALRSGDVPPESLSGHDVAAAVPGADPEAFGSTWVEAMAGIARDVAGALVAAHAAGVVHRDIKPSNILLRPDGLVQLVDFGLAHLEDMPTLTLSGEFAGTPYYVAPEQVENVRGGVDGRADVFSLGVTLYECASLQRPFTGQTPLEVLTAICGREPEPLRRVAAHLPVDLERLCRRALEKEPQHRYPSMQAFADDIAQLLAYRPLHTAPLSPLQRSRRWARRRPWRAAFLGLAALLLIGTPVALLVANSKIRSERDRVMEEAQRSRRAVEHFVGHFNRSPDDPETDAAARELLDRGALRLRFGEAEDYRVRASLLHASARAYLQLGRPNEARPLLDRALSIWRREGDTVSDERARVLGDLARVHLSDDQPGLARDLATRALEEISSAGSGVAFENQVRITIAASNVALGDSILARSNLLALEGLGQDAESDAADVWRSIGQLELGQGQNAQARGAFTQSLELLQNAWAPSGDRLAEVYDGLAEAAARIEGASSSAAEGHRARAARLRSRPAGPVAEGPQGDAETLPFLGEPSWTSAYRNAFDRGVAAIQAGRIDDARRHFGDAHGARPAPAVAAYNLACVESRANRVDEAAAWLDRARQEGFACLDRRVQSLKSDPDLEALRQSSVGQAAIARLSQQWELARAFESRTIEVPASGSGPRASATAPPLLVVVHGYGQAPADVASSHWKEIAEALGATLLVPCGPFFVGKGPEEGASWSPDPGDLWGQPDVFGRPILEQVRGLLRRGEIDRDRVWVGGEGLGALLALDLLLNNPGLFRNGWLIDPILHADSGGGTGHLPKVLGTRLAVSISEGPPPAEALAKDASGYASDVERWLSVAGRWEGSVRVVRRGHQEPNALAQWLTDS